MGRMAGRASPGKVLGNLAKHPPRLSPTETPAHRNTDPPIMATHRKTIESSAADLAAAVEEAQFNLAYYSRQAVIRTNPVASAEAKGLVAAWQTTLAARMAALHQATHP